MVPRREPHVISCEGEELASIAHCPIVPGEIGAVIVVGGPQYRVGSHRMFVDMADVLAASGIVCLRFDCRGMGDSSGEFPGFERLNPDIRSAVDCIQSLNAQRILLIGLCDGASASLIYAPTDDRVRGLVLLNPWANTPQTEAKATLRSYYIRRVLQRQFWLDLLKGPGDLLKYAKSVVGTIRAARRWQTQAAQSLSYLDLMRRGFENFSGPIWIPLSENDQTAREFEVWFNSNNVKESLSNAKVETSTLTRADHTLSNPDQLRGLASDICSWVKQNGL